MQQSVTNETNEVDEAKKKRNIFIFRMIAFTLFACIIPFVFIAWRYDIFRTSNDINPKVSLTGWGFLGLIIVFFFIKYCLNVLKRAIPFSMTYQIVNGVIKIIMPLLLLLFVVDALENNITLFKHSLIVTIICEGVAIPINPLPKYMHDKGIEYAGGLMDLFITKWKGGNK
jgi:hypothetical protein